ncbi:MAG: carbohydrate porin [Planctomycetota bacterium]|jgi:porin
MKRSLVLIVLIALAIPTGLCNAEHEHRDLYDWLGISDETADSGLEMAFGVTNIYQHNVRGGISRSRRAGRYSGSYDIELTADLQKFLDIEGASLFVHTEGFWSRTGGIDEPSVGSAFGVNADGYPRNAIVVTELWYEQSILQGQLLFRVGKMDITGGFERHGYPLAFDASSFANDETTQFLNGALVNNPTIPFPDYALGISAFYNPVDWLYAAAGVVDAQSDFRTTGFETTFGGEDSFFYVFETGATPCIASSNGPLKGAYRVGLWVDAQDKFRFSNGKRYRNDTGFYLSCDQMIHKENNDPEDPQGLGLFARFGYANSDLNEIGNFWSTGVQYQGFFEGRDDDVLGLGFAQGIFSDFAAANEGAGYSDDHEAIAEFYYNLALAPSLNISPSVQYVFNPGGDRTVSDAVVLGLRLQMTF